MERHCEPSLATGGSILERAAFSDDARVVLYAEDELPIDYFGVYRLPIPEPFQTEPGKRCIRVTLAYDPRCAGISATEPTTQESA